MIVPMKRALQSMVVALVLRVVHAALTELQRLDSSVRRELEQMPEGMGYAVETGYRAPTLYVRWCGGQLQRCAAAPPAPCCALRLKNLPLAFLFCTGQMGVAQAYARHAFTISGDVADVMKLARLINLVEAYLFPPLITRRIMTDIPPLQVNPLRVYGGIAFGFLCSRYRLSR